MIAEPAYVVELIRKQMDGTLSEKEKGQLAAAKLIYTEEEWWDMTVTALEAWQQEQPPTAAPNWRPPIIDKLERREHQRILLKKWRIPIAAGILVVLAGATWLASSILQYNVKPVLVGDCELLDEKMTIPASLQTATIMLPDSTIISSVRLKADSILNLYNMQARQSQPGVLELTAAPGRVSVDSVKSATVEVRTKAKQQYTVILPNTASILLNAGTTLKVSYDPLDSLYYVFLAGEALVKIPEQAKSMQRLIVETPNAQIQSAGGKFAILAMSWYNQTTLLQGELVAFTRKGEQSKRMNKPGEQVLISTHKLVPDIFVDSIKYNSRKANIEQAIVWTKAIRYYNDVPLRQFVADLCQWYGLEISNINCVPENQRITTAFCYQVPPDSLYAQIRAKGIAVHEDHGILTFCDPPAKKMPWAKAATPIPHRPALIAAGDRKGLL